jgi:site-specific DNA-methyltransferase (adenine-specific)
MSITNQIKNDSGNINTIKKYRKGTKTSAFGSPGRFGHDSSEFYESRLYEGIEAPLKMEFVENYLPLEATNKIFCKSSESMTELPDCSVHLMVTSPPYNVGKEYDQDLTLAEYRNLIKRVMQEVYRVLVPGGRVCFNVANLGRRPYLPLDAFITEDILSIGFLMRGQIIWNKASSASGSTAWGSWCSPANPTLRDIHEYILVFSKGIYSRKRIEDRKSTILKDEFLELTKSIWTFSAESARKIGHPAPFPLELPRRCMELYTYSSEVVLDPFMGSGATAVASLKAGRRYVGYDISEEYVKLAQQRIKKTSESMSQSKLGIYKD